MVGLSGVIRCFRQSLDNFLVTFYRATQKSVNFIRTSKTKEAHILERIQASWDDPLEVGVIRFELTTPRTPYECATRLRYTPTRIGYCLKQHPIPNRCNSARQGIWVKWRIPTTGFIRYWLNRVHRAIYWVLSVPMLRWNTVFFPLWH